MPTIDSHREWARVGASTRLEQFRQEQLEILRAFPELRRGLMTTSPSGPAERSTKRKSTMSAAARRAVSQRMRAYWAKRRAEKHTVTKGR